MQLNKEAEELNQIIKSNSSVIYDLLSDKGKSIFFPKKGILSQSAEAKLKKINATIGTALEDDSSPMHLCSIQKNIGISPSDAYSYAPSYGKQDIREKWKQLMIEKNPNLKGNEISLPVVTCALTHGLNMAAYMFVNKDDTVIIPNLYWENYDLIFCNAYSGKLEHFNTFKKVSEGNYKGLDTESIKQKLNGHSKGKKILLLNFPNNPSGYTPSEKEAQEIVKIIKESAESGNKIVVFIDDAYFGLVYEDGIEKKSLFSYLCSLHENVLAIKIDGPTKEDYVWGFRVGFITYGIKNGKKELYSALESKTAGAIRGDISNAPNISQSLLMKAYSSEKYSEEKNEKYKTLKARYDKVKEILKKNNQYTPFFSALPFNSGYFMCVEIKNNDAEKVRKLLLEKYDTGTICFGNILRIAFSAVPISKIDELFENIYSACKDLAQRV